MVDENGHFRVRDLVKNFTRNFPPVGAENDPMSLPALALAPRRPEFAWEASPSERSRWLNLMANLPLLDRAKSETTQALLQHACFRRVGPETALYREGLPASESFFLLDGVVRIFQSDARGSEYTPKIFRAPAHFGDLPALAGVETYRSSAETLTQCCVATVPFSVIEALLEFDHGLALVWLRQVARQHVVTIDADRQNVFGGLVARVASALLSYADVFGVADGKLTGIDARLSYQRLASQVGCTRRSAISVMQSLAKRGAAETSSGGWRVDREVLAAELEPGHLSLAYSQRDD